MFLGGELVMFSSDTRANGMRIRIILKAGLGRGNAWSMGLLLLILIQSEINDSY